jgi:protein FAM32A
MPGEFLGGALSFKGDKKKSSRKRKKSATHEVKTGGDEKISPEVSTNEGNDPGTDDLTEAERKALKRRRERERIEAEKVAQKSHRERVEEFNNKLASLTELNDIPRVSAAGNG